MADEINVAGKIYISSKRAARETTYTQDYIGQLARGGKIDAKRVGGLWFVLKESLEGYKKGAEQYKPEQPDSSPKKEPQSLVTFDGKEHISAARASQLTGYNQDYIGQLARSGKILSRQVGNRWYIDNESLMEHKREKDALLAGVQADSVGLTSFVASVPPKPHEATPASIMTYKVEHNDLMPTLSVVPSEDEVAVDTSPVPTKSTPAAAVVESESKVPIRVMSQQGNPTPTAPSIREHNSKQKKSDISISKAIKPAYVAGAFVVAILASMAGLFAASQHASQGTESASSGSETTSWYQKVVAKGESVLSPELIYRRTE